MEGAFVGRHDELALLRSWWSEAAAGSPRVVLVEGAGGIGKTTLLDRLLVGPDPPVDLKLWAACQEDASTPYLALASALRLLEGGADLFAGSSIEPDPGQLGATLPERRLGTALRATDAILEAARHRRLALVVDDLHWADEPTIEVVLHLVHTLAHGDDARRSVLLVCAYRPVADDSAAARVVARARRLPLTRELVVGGLDDLDLHELVVDVTGLRPSKPLLRALAQASGGNPLVVRTLLDRLDAFGGLATRGSELVRRGHSELLAGLGDLDRLLRDRLAALTPAAEAVATTAAFLGDGGTLGDLRAVADFDRDRFATTFDELRTARVLDDDGEGYRFTHSQLRQLLYHRPRGRRRSELHLRVADHLEPRAQDDPATAIAVAHHLRRAGEDVARERLLEWSLQAGWAAESLGAWAEAADAYDAALPAIGPVREPSALTGLVSARAARAHWFIHDNAGAQELALAAVDRARALRDLELWSGALLINAQAVWSSPLTGRNVVPDTALYEEFLEAAGDRAPHARALVHRALATFAVNALRVSAATPHVAAVRRLADDDDELLSSACLLEGMCAFYGGDLDAARRHLLASGHHAQRRADARLGAVAHSRLALVELAAGRLDLADDLAKTAQRETRPRGFWAEHAFALGCEAAVAYARGDLAAVIDVGSEALREAEWAAWGAGVSLAAPRVARALAETGDHAAAVAALDRWEAFGSPGASMLRPLIDLRGPDPQDAADGLSAVPLNVPPPELATLVGPLMVRVEVVAALRLDEPLDAAIAALEGLVARGITFDPGFGSYIPDVIAAARSATSTAPSG